MSDIVRIGNCRGRIALYLDETDAIDMAEHYGSADGAYDELMAAVAKAYPPTEFDPIGRVRIVMRIDEHGRLRPEYEVTA